MNNQFKVTFKKDHVFVKVSGAKSYDFALTLWTEIMKICDKHKCFNIFGIDHTTIPLTTMEAYDHIKIFQMAGVTEKHRIAWVEKDPEAYKVIYFAETVLQNRGYKNARLFSTEEEARKWLFDEESI